MPYLKFTKDFSKEYKYTVGESLKKETIELLALIYRAIPDSAHVDPARGERNILDCRTPHTLRQAQDEPKRDF